MTRTIVLPLDGTADSERAIPFARVLARHLPARIVLVRGVLMGPMPSEPGVPPRELEDAEAELARVAEQLRAAGIEVDWFTINDEAAWSIITAATEQTADLIVMATHGRGALGRAFRGSIADRVLHDGPAPVLLIPPRAHFNWPPDARGLRIVLALDGSPLARRAFAPAVELARATSGEIVLTHAIEPPYHPLTDELLESPSPRHRLAKSRPTAVGLAAERLEAEGIAFTIEERIGNPADAILKVARSRQAHLIAMSTHGRQGLPRLMLGSVAEGVLLGTRLPLLLCGAHAHTALGRVTVAPLPMAAVPASVASLPGV